MNEAPTEVPGPGGGQRRPDGEQRNGPPQRRRRATSGGSGPLAPADGQESGLQQEECPGGQGQTGEPGAPAAEQFVPLREHESLVGRLEIVSGKGSVPGG
ncbi:MAG: hypothetical protein R3E97_08865 [Candidatus Eisenbacteria bacterium]